MIGEAVNFFSTFWKFLLRFLS